MQSKKTHVPFEFYDLPGCPPPSFLKTFKRNSAHGHQRKNLGARLQGMELNSAPYEIQVLRSKLCTILCEAEISPHRVKWLRKLVAEQYRINLTLDSLPVLMRSTERNFAVRGFPIGFKAPASFTGGEHDEYFLYNHLQFTITYQHDTSSDGIFITGFDACTVSIQHEADHSTCLSSRRRQRRLDEEDGDAQDDEDDSQEDTEDENEDYDSGEDEESGTNTSPRNDPATYLPLFVGSYGKAIKVTYSYEIRWKQTDLSWADRWDIYLISYLQSLLPLP